MDRILETHVVLEEIDPRLGPVPLKLHPIVLRL
jgi:hypothetical protein